MKKLSILFILVSLFQLSEISHAKSYDYLESPIFKLIMKANDAYFEAKNADKAVQYLEEAIQLIGNKFSSDPAKEHDELGHQSLYDLYSLLSDMYMKQGRYEDSIQTLKRHITKKTLLIEKLIRKGGYLKLDKKDKEAIPYLEEALALAGEMFSSDPTIDRKELHRRSLHDLAKHLSDMYIKQGQYEDSVQLLKHHKAIRQLVDQAGFLYRLYKKPEKAILYMEAALILAEKKYRSEPTTPQLELNQSSLYRSYNFLSEMYIEVGRYEDSIQNLKDHIPNKELLIDNLYRIYTNLKLDKKHEASRLFVEEVYKLAEKEFGTDPTKQEILAGINSELAGLYFEQSWYEEALQAQHRYLAIMEKTDKTGKSRDNKIFMATHGIAAIYVKQGRYNEALPKLERNVAIAEEKWGQTSTWVELVYGLGHTYMKLDRFEEAEQTLKKLVEWIKKRFGTDPPMFYSDYLAYAQNDLAEIYIAQGRYREARPLLIHSLELMALPYGGDYSGNAGVLLRLAQLYNAESRYNDALSMLNRVMPVYEKYYGLNHPRLANVLNIQSITYHGLNQQQNAIESIRRAANIYRKRIKRTAGNRSSARLIELQGARDIFVHYVDALMNLMKLRDSKRNDLANEAFELGQLARATDTSAALAGMGARFATGDNQLSNIVRERQDLTKRWRRLNNKLDVTVSRSSHDQGQENVSVIRGELSDIDLQMQELDNKIAKEFPEYNQLIGSFVISLEEVQKMLSQDEALITYLLADKHSYLWIVRSKSTMMYLLEYSSEKIEEIITKLRQELDPTGVSQLADIRPFDTETAYQLYQNILAPAESALNGVNNIIIVPDKALQSIPFGVLVTEKPQSPKTNFASYRAVSWLGKKYALTTLPSVASLKALRAFAKKSKAKEPFVGFGDPLLAGDPGSGRGITLVMLFSQGNVADRDVIKSLPRLPETADELKAIAKALKTGIKNVYLKDQATENRVKTMDLFSKQIIAFATHGLVAGEITGLAEPALVLTPPEQSTEKDDGLLTASEVAQLKLNADLVLLSACNTAAADGTPGAEGLSGLAKAFFYAGSRSLVVSHWAVSSDAAVELTTRMFDESAKHAEIGKSEALKRSMLALMNNHKKPYFAHPMFWAPFVIVGEGSTMH